MEREIKFRGLRDDGKWLYGSLVTGLFVNVETNISVCNILDIKEHKDFDCFQDLDEMTTDVITESVGQFTGLKDKNGKEIYEGDHNDDFDVVMWCDNRNGWAVKTYDFPTKTTMFCHCYNCEANFELYEISDDFEITGNIHETK